MGFSRRQVGAELQREQIRQGSRDDKLGLGWIGSKLRQDSREDKIVGLTPTHSLLSCNTYYKTTCACACACRIVEASLVATVSVDEVKPLVASVTPVRYRSLQGFPARKSLIKVKV
ncbi:hypothetical protein J6590_043371 [Homalodisca vitripennis]|nr:hypothetical protein J6590_043371 [Homalodisca vitripennis]